MILWQSGTECRALFKECPLTGKAPPRGREYFYAALDRHFPGLKQHYIKSFGSSYVVSSPHEHELMLYLAELCRKNHIMLGTDSVFKWIEEFPDTDPIQPELF